MRLLAGTTVQRRVGGVVLIVALSAVFGSVAQAGPVGPDGGGYFPTQAAADDGSLIADRSMSVPRIARPDGGGYFGAQDAGGAVEVVRTVEVRSFSWRDAGVGATGALAVLLIVAGLSILTRRRHHPSVAGSAEGAIDFGRRTNPEPPSKPARSGAC